MFHNHFRRMARGQWAGAFPQRQISARCWLVGDRSAVACAIEQGGRLGAPLVWLSGRSSDQVLSGASKSRLVAVTNFLLELDLFQK